ncbi:hypothetical protein SAMN05216516_101460 [Izhakiella capsodis]|uniref:Uncharacterized protein n=1 Tax=Izhakiella capsodis TaxID=1367852 RepID=A0A1I4UZU9_9GAMM|nr:hypothetical protein SAMN05216516_101460 [Izhakiella capsodis]
MVVTAALVYTGRTFVRLATSAAAHVGGDVGRRSAAGSLWGSDAGTVRQSPR